MESVYQPRGTGLDALDELDHVDWATLDHAYGTGVVILGAGDGSLAIAGDVSGSLAELRLNPSHAIAQGLYSNICHQGTIYQATAYAVPFVVAIAAGDVPADVRTALVALLGDIAIAASYPDVGGSRAAGGDHVNLLVTRALAASLERLSTIRTPDLLVLIAAIPSLLADPTDERRDAVDLAIEALSPPPAP